MILQIGRQHDLKHQTYYGHWSISDITKININEAKNMLIKMIAKIGRIPENEISLQTGCKNSKLQVNPVYGSPNIIPNPNTTPASDADNTGTFIFDGGNCGYDWFEIPGNYYWETNNNIKFEIKKSYR